MSDPAESSVQNLLPVQAYFDAQDNFQTFIGQNKPFYATVNPEQSGLHITDSTIDSTTIGATTPSTGVFTNVSTTTGQVSTSPVTNTDIANKQYVDAVAQGLKAKQAVKCATTGDIVLLGLQTIDSYTTLAGDRVLVKDQLISSQNGIYIAAAGAWTRSTDMDVWSEVPGAYTVALNGSVNVDTGWVCTAADTGTIGVTAMPWVQFSAASTYYAGTGLTLAANTFSITNTGVTAGSYGSASSSAVFAVNAQGQLTSATATPIAIAASQITSGTIASGLISGSYTGITGVGTLTAGTWNATPISNAYLANSSITINGSLVSLGSGITVTAATPYSVTFANTGGAASGTSFDGSAAKTIDYSTVGAPKADGTGASGTWSISINGNAATATTAGSATTATTATNLAGGAAGSVPYQSGSGATSFLAAGSSGQVLSTNGASAPTWIGPSAFLNNITTTQGSLIYRNSVGWVNLAPGTAGQVLQTGGAGANPSWLDQSSIAAGSAATATSATTATNLAGGGAGYIPYQSGSGATSFVSAGTTGQVLTSNGSSAPTWTAPTANITISDDTTTNATRYPLFSTATTGSISTEYTSSTKYQFNPSTGVLTATGFSGSGASLTSLTAGNLSGTIPSGVLGNSSLYIGTTAIALNRSSASQSLTGVSIDGSAGSATTATTATNANNVAITDDTSTNSTFYPTFVSNSTGNLGVDTSSTKLQYNPSTGTLAATVHKSLNSANNLQFTGANTGLEPVLSATGTDTNVALAIKTQGTGAIDLAAGSRGVNISNGGTVTAITRTAGGSNYNFSVPTITISAPTTAGGVQATATCAVTLNSVSIASGGTGYTAGDTLTVVGGTGTAVVLTVSTVSAGVITAVTISNFGFYTVVPSNPMQVTGGTGTGATFTPNFGVSVSSLTITNAGSGYVEQPTVTFSGGGGSGAAAYATVGSGAIIKALGASGTQTLDFQTPSSASMGVPALRIRDTQNDSYVMLQGGTAYTSLVAQGNSGAHLYLASNGSSGTVRFMTNSTNFTEQMRVAHTASAVNYVQVTGAATGNGTVVSAQGSDSNVPLIFQSKGTGQLRLTATAGQFNAFTVTPSGSTTYNYFNAAIGGAGTTPALQALGPDTNIDLALTPKGTGKVVLTNGLQAGTF